MGDLEKRAAAYDLLVQQYRRKFAKFVMLEDLKKL
jgi:hypothetical protein